MNRGALFISVVFLVTFAACGKKAGEDSQTQPSDQPAVQQPAAPESPAQAAPAPVQAQTPANRPSQAAGAPERRAAAPAPASESAPAAANKAAEAAPKPAEPTTGTLPSGTGIDVRLAQEISSEASQPGEPFKAELDEDLEVNGLLLAPRGSTVTGKIVHAQPSGRVKGRAALSIALTAIQVGDNSYPIRTNTLAFEAESTTKKDAAKVGIGAGLGAVIGAVAGGGKGAAIGAAVGGGAGTATVLATKGEKVIFPAEKKFSFVLGADLSMKVVRK